MRTSHLQRVLNTGGGRRGGLSMQERQSKRWARVSCKVWCWCRCLPFTEEDRLFPDSALEWFDRVSGHRQQGSIKFPVHLISHFAMNIIMAALSLSPCQMSSITLTLLNTVSLRMWTLCEVWLLMHLHYRITHRGSSAAGVAANDMQCAVLYIIRKTHIITEFVVL